MCTKIEVEISNKNLEFPSLVEAIINRYDDIELINGSRTVRVSESSSTSDTSVPQVFGLSSSLPESQNLIPVFVPKSLRQKKLTNIVINDQRVRLIGDTKRLEKFCGNLLELDLARNEIGDWEQVKIILLTLKKLKFLNLCHNSLSKDIQCKHGHTNTADKENQIVEEIPANILPLCSNSGTVNSETVTCLNSTNCYFETIWSLDKEEHEFENLKTLILNSCHINLMTVECFLKRLPGLEELHLASNNYSSVNFSEGFIVNSLKTLHFSSNNLTDWSDVIRLGKTFPNLDSLVISENQLGDLNFSSEQRDEFTVNFSKLRVLNLNKLFIKEWSTIDDLRRLPSLKNLRIKGVPLTKEFSDELKFCLLVSHLKDDLEYLNGSVITHEEINKCHRKFLGYYTDAEEKPTRYHELETERKRKFEELLKLKFDRKVDTVAVDFAGNVPKKSQILDQNQKQQSINLNKPNNNDSNNNKYYAPTSKSVAWNIPSLNNKQNSSSVSSNSMNFLHL